MKKILMLVVAAMSLSFVACDGSKKTTEEATEETAPAATEETTEAAGDDLLSKYEEFVNKTIPLVEKMKSGDADAAQEYASLAEELGKFVQENQEAFANMTPEEAQKYAELSQKLAEAAQ